MLAEKAIQENEFELSIKYLRKLLKELQHNQSQKSKVALNIINLLIETGRASEAYEEIKLFEEEFSTLLSSDSILRTKIEYFKILSNPNLDNIDSIIENFKQLIEPSPPSDHELNIRITSSLALAYAAKEDYQSALKYAKKIEEESPSPDLASIGTTLKNTFIMLSSTNVTELFKIPEKNNNFTLDDVIVLYGLNMKANAISVFEKMDKNKIRQNPIAPFVIFSLASFAAKNKDYDSAKLFLNDAKGISISPLFSHKFSMLSAEIQIQSGNLKEAIQIYKDFIEQNPKHPANVEIKILLANSLLFDNQNQNALQIFLELISNNQIPSSEKIKIIEMAGRAFIKKKDFASAQSIISSADKISPPESAGLSQMLYAEIEFEKGNYKKAAEIYAKIADNYPDYRLSALEGQIKSLFKAESYQNLIDVLNQSRDLLSNSESYQEILFIEALSLKNSGKLDEALNSFVAFTEKYPNSSFAPICLFEAAEIMFEKGKYDSASNMFNTIINKYQDKEIAQASAYKKIHSELLSGNQESAVKTALSLAEKWPKSRYAALASIWLANTYRDENKVSEAENLYLKIKTDFHEYRDIAADALLEVAKIAKNTNDKQRAILFLNEISEKYPDQSACSYAYFLHGDILSESNDYEKAIPFYMKTAMRRPFSELAAAAYGRIGDCYFALAQHDAKENLPKAIEFYSKALEIPQLPIFLMEQALFKAGRCEELIGDIGSALAKYKEIIINYRVDWQRGSKRDSIWLVKAATSAIKIYLSKGDKNSIEEAEKIYTTLLDMNINAISQMKANIDAANEKFQNEVKKQ